MTRGYLFSVFALLVLLFTPIISLEAVFSQTDFYQGKTVTVIASTAPGGTGDLRVKALVPFLRKHIPGSPTVVIEYMEGGVAAKQQITCFGPHGLTGLPWAQ